MWLRSIDPKKVPNLFVKQSIIHYYYTLYNNFLPKKQKCVFSQILTFFHGVWFKLSSINHDLNDKYHDS